MISLTDVLSTLQTHWHTAAPAGVVTQFPGVALDATGLTAWYEFWVSQLDEPPYRTGGRSRQLLAIDVHCFARGSDKRRAAALAESAKAALSHCELAVNSDSEPSEVTAWLRIREGRVRDLTRESTSIAQLPLQQMMVSLAAVAEEAWG